MGIGPYTQDYSEKRTDIINGLHKEIKGTREKMEAETRTFIEAAKKFSLEWIQRETNPNISQLKSEACSGNVEIDKDKLSKIPCLEDLPFRIKDIVEEQLNRDDYWIHRSRLLHADISRDYIEFKKEKARKDLTSSIRMIFGCAAEIFADVKDEKPEDKVWVKQRGKRKYICILRFSDEMTASLDRYFTMLEELFVLEYEISEKIKKEAENREGKNEPEKS
ncbi:MAG: hypothetical protein QG610_1479 [Euryarchaeota archaeon]|nr:hypothetical protein [Euryarchaeota archaeon]